MRVHLFALALIATTMQACAPRAEPLPPECVDAMQKMEKLGGTLKANGSIPDDYIKAQEKDYATLKARSEEHSLNSSHSQISYAVFCLKKKKQKDTKRLPNRAPSPNCPFQRCVD